MGIGHDPGRDLGLFEHLVGQAADFLADPDEIAEQRRARGALALALAAREVQTLVAEAAPRGTVLSVEVIMRNGPVVRTTPLRRLPGPLALLIIGSECCAPGAAVEVMIQRAGLPDVHRSARWPLDLAAAEALTRPEADDAIAGRGASDRGEP